MPPAKAPALGELLLEPPSTLTTNDGNPRYILDERFEDLKHSLEHDPDMMKARPLIAVAGPKHRKEREAEGYPERCVIAGNMRLRAVEVLGWKSVPTIYFDLTPEECAEWLLRDNAAYGEWQPDAVAELVYNMSQRGQDLRLTGFAASEVEAIIASVAGAEPPEGFTQPDENTDYTCPNCGYQWSGSPAPASKDGGATEANDAGEAGEAVEVEA